LQLADRMTTPSSLIGPEHNALVRAPGNIISISNNIAGTTIKKLEAREENAHAGAADGQAELVTLESLMPDARKRRIADGKRLEDSGAEVLVAQEVDGDDLGGTGDALHGDVVGVEDAEVLTLYPREDGGGEGNVRGTSHAEGGHASESGEAEVTSPVGAEAEIPLGDCALENHEKRGGEEGETSGNHRWVD